MALVVEDMVSMDHVSFERMGSQKSHLGIEIFSGGNENGHFGIKTDTGDIFIVSPPAPGGYTLTVTATNTTSRQTASASVSSILLPNMEVMVA